VGRVGVPISTVENMAVLLDGVSLGEASTSMTINATAAIMLAMYISVGQAQGVPLDRLRGTTQNDILKEYIARNTYIFPLEQSLRLTTDIIEFCAEDAAKLALRTQQIIALESGVTRTADPMGGSFYLEKLTQEIEKHAFAEIEKVDKMGGAVKAIENGYIQAKIRESAFKQQMEIESRTKKIVGVNILKDAKPQKITIHTIDPRSVRKQIASVKRFKKNEEKRKTKIATERSLRKLKAGLTDNQNLVLLIIEAVKAKATTGEISDAVREKYGEFHPKIII
jgi:methylmalonyl-CoA mutase N-terminal domain/subunit